MVSSRPTGFQHSNVKWCLPGLPGKPWGASLLFPYSKFPKAFKGSLPLVPPKLGLSHGSLTVLFYSAAFCSLFYFTAMLFQGQDGATVKAVRLYGVTKIRLKSKHDLEQKCVQHSNLKLPNVHKNNVKPPCVPPRSGPSMKPPGVARPQTPVEQPGLGRVETPFDRAPLCSPPIELGEHSMGLSNGVSWSGTRRDAI